MRYVLTALAFIAAPALAAPPCPVAGERMHWVVDYCMAKLETDDEIAASDCIAGELEKAPRNACVAKRSYKQRLCELVVSRKNPNGTVAACVADPRFAGSTVRNGGVGGGS
jgi:hypothetical protein